MKNDVKLELWKSQKTRSDLKPYARDRDSKNMLAYNEFAYKKTNDHCKLEDRFQKKANFSIREIADKKTAYNEGRL